MNIRLVIAILMIIPTVALGAGAPAPVVENCVAAPGQVWNVQTVEDDLSSGSAAKQWTDPQYRIRYSRALQGRVFEKGSWRLYFRVFYQPPDRGYAVKIAGLLTRLYCYGQVRLGPYGAFYHPADTNGDPVPVYIDTAHSGGGIERPEAMYILRPSEIRDPVELFREVAHEYSHLTIPGVRGFLIQNGAEDWANGYLGEVLYAGWYGEDTSATLVPRDAVASWAQRRSLNLERNFLKLGPTELGGPNGAGHFWEFVGMLLYVDRIYGLPVLARALGYAVRESAYSYAQFPRPLADAMRTDSPDALVVPGMLATPVAPGPAAQPGSIAAGQAVRTWIFLTTGINAASRRYRVQVDSTSTDWRLRGAQIERGDHFFLLGSLGPHADTATVLATGDGWYLNQWRNLGASPVEIRGWSWSLLKGKK